MNDGRNHPLLEQRPDVLAQIASNDALLRRRARSQRRAGDPGALAHHDREVELALGGFQKGDLQQPPLDREQIEIPRNVITADDVEDQVDTAAVGDPLRFGDPVSGAVVERVRSAKLPCRFAFVVAAGGGQHHGAKRPRQLNRGSANAAGPAVDQDRLAVFQLAALEHVGPDREKCFRNTGRLSAG